MLQPFSSHILNQLLRRSVRSWHKATPGMDFLSGAIPYWIFLTVMAPAIAGFAICCVPPGLVCFAVLTVIMPAYAAIHSNRYLGNPATEAIMLTNVTDENLFKSLVFAWLYRFRPIAIILAIILPTMLTNLTVDIILRRGIRALNGFSCIKSVMGSLYCSQTPLHYGYMSGSINEQISLILAVIAGIGPTIAILSTTMIAVMWAVALAGKFHDPFRAGSVAIAVCILLEIIIMLVSNELLTYLLGDGSPALGRLLQGVIYSLLFIVGSILFIEGSYRSMSQWVRTTQ